MILLNVKFLCYSIIIMHSDLYGDSDDNVLELKMVNYHAKDFKIDQYGRTRVVHPRFKNRKGLIVFYSPNCGHCRDPAFVKTWKGLSVMFGNRFPIAAVNCQNKRQKNDELARLSDVQGYPTIKLVYEDGTLGEEYQGARDMKSFKQFICKKAGVCSRS